MGEMKRYVVLLVLGVFLTSCANGPAPSGGPVETRQGDLHVRVTSHPSPPRASETTTFSITVSDPATGEVLQDVEIRPVIDMYMATSRMLVPFERLEPPDSGQVQIQAFLEHEGTLKISVGVKRGGILTPVRLPDVPVLPAE